MFSSLTNIPIEDHSKAQATPIVAVAEHEWVAWAAHAPRHVTALAEHTGFNGQAERVLTAQRADGSIGPILFGLGAGDDPMLIGALSARLPPGRYRLDRAPSALSPELCAVAWGIGAYAFERYKPRPTAAPRLIAPDGVDAEETSRIVAATWFVRDLVNTPAQDMSPAHLHAVAEDIARACGAEFKAIVGNQLLTENYPLIHAVGRGAHEPPRLLHVAWGDKKHPTVALVGKGVTFDTGGLGLKTVDGMRLMKKDMGGAAHALALAALAMQVNLHVRLEVFLPIVENAVSARSYHPGDIVRSRKGLTVEVDHTDAEGRLILADALTRACEERPDLLIDFATLTGAARVALGPEVPPMFTSDDALSDELASAARETRDPLWRMPLWAPYDHDLASPIADLKNTGDGTMAGPIMGALFLRRFVDAPSWAHFDLYAWTPKARPSHPVGGDAQTLRACWRVLTKRYGV